jgi:protoporphyrinogen oxidase
MTTNRRDFIRFVVAGAISAGCPVDLALLAAQTQDGPAVEGEENRICHQVRDGKVFSLPPVSARHDVVIVGGGVSGLSAAYMLRHHDFLLLEKEPHWGGNAYLQTYQGADYAAGAAFLAEDEYAYSFAKEIGLEPLPIRDWDGSIINGEFVPDTWGDGLDKLPYPAAVREGFKKFRGELLKIDLEKRNNELYNQPFSSFMKDAPAEVKLWWDTFGPSNWGAASNDTAATIGIFTLQDMAKPNRNDRRYTWPGGLGALTKKLSATLLASSSERMQSGATTVAVVPGSKEVQVTYMLGPELKTVAAKAVIMATPKFITRYIVQGLPDKQKEAMHQLRYIPYPVVNLIFDKPVYNKGYDTWCPGNTFTDFIVADWTIRNQSGYHQKYNILTFYTPLRETDRPKLLNEQGSSAIAAGVLKDFQKLYPGSNVDPVEVHIYRRGHPLYMSTPGLYTQVQPLVRQPMDRIFFANTDSEGPISETNQAILASKRAIKELEHRLAGQPIPKHTAVHEG